jgi:hypothetical protein
MNKKIVFNHGPHFSSTLLLDPNLFYDANGCPMHVILHLRQVCLPLLQNQTNIKWTRFSSVEELNAPYGSMAGAFRKQGET